MALIDHLFLYVDELAAHAALDPLGFGGVGRWDASRVLPCRVILGYVPGAISLPDGSLGTAQRPILMDGYHLNVCLPGPRDDLIAMPECILVSDRDKGVPGAARGVFELHTKVSDATMDAVLGVTPLFAGTNYPFGPVI